MLRYQQVDHTALVQVLKKINTAPTVPRKQVPMKSSSESSAVLRGTGPLLRGVHGEKGPELCIYIVIIAAI